jgi:hypothetical protein
MAYTVFQLINDSYYLSGKNTPIYNEPTEGDVNNGLRMLNQVIAIKTANDRMIPYYLEYNFNFVVGQEEYFIPNLLSIETANFYIQNVRYPMFFINRRAYQGSGRADNVDSLPYTYYFERCFGGSNLFVYFFPSDAYAARIWGKFSLAQVTSLFQDLSLTIDLYYITYLQYALAEFICQYFNITLQPQSAQKLTELENVIIDIAPMDLTNVKRSTLQNTMAANYAWINLAINGFGPMGGT